jgi:hypothetical protein
MPQEVQAKTLRSARRRELVRYLEISYQTAPLMKGASILALGGRYRAIRND